jgi:hypothetical protein
MRWLLESAVGNRWPLCLEHKRRRIMSRFHRLLPRRARVTRSMIFAVRRRREAGARRTYVLTRRGAPGAIFWIDGTSSHHARELPMRQRGLGFDRQPPQRRRVRDLEPRRALLNCQQARCGPKGKVSSDVCVDFDMGGGGFWKRGTSGRQLQQSRCLQEGGGRSHVGHGPQRCSRTCVYVCSVR